MDGEDAFKEKWPTKSNIRAGLTRLVKETVAGDSLLFFYSGHGTQVPNFNGREKDGRDEAICP